MVSLEDLTQLLLASLDDVTRVASMLNTTLQQATHPAFELSTDGVIWYLNGAAATAIGVPPQQAVGTRLTTYVVDALMTQRRLDALSGQSQAQTWPDAWQQAPDQTLPCRLTGFAIPRSLGSERPRLIVWSSPLEVRPAELPAEPDHAPLANTFPADQRIRSRDLDPLRKKLNKNINQFCRMLGMSQVNWYAWLRSPDTPIPNRTVELHLRLLDAMPDLLPPPTHPAELVEALRTQRGIEISYTDLALLMGIERRAGYSWSHGSPASDQVQSLLETLLRMLLEKPREAWDQYRKLVDRQAEIEGIDLWTTKSWTPPAGSESDDQEDGGPEAANRASPTDPLVPFPVGDSKRKRGRPRSVRKK